MDCFSMYARHRSSLKGRYEPSLTASFPAQVKWFKASMIAGGASEKPLESMATTYLYGKPCAQVNRMNHS